MVKLYCSLAEPCLFACGKKRNVDMKKTAQQIQDDIFRKMSADRKIKLGSSMWRLAKALAGGKIDFRINGSTTSTGKNS